MKIASNVRNLFLICCWIISLISPPLFGAFEEKIISAKAGSFCNACVAYKADGYSLYHNPANLSTLQDMNLGFSYLKLYELSDLELNYFTFSYPRLRPLAFAFS